MSKGKPSYKRVEFCTRSGKNVVFSARVRRKAHAVKRASRSKKSN